MELVAGATNSIILMTHFSRDGESRLLPKCTLPLTGAGCVRRILTDLAYNEIHDGAFVLRERAPGVSVEEIIAKTASKLIVPDDVVEMCFEGRGTSHESCAEPGAGLLEGLTQEAIRCGPCSNSGAGAQR